MPEFKEVNFLHFKDIFFEDYEIALSYTLLSSILKSAGLPVEFAKRGIRTPAQANDPLFMAFIDHIDDFLFCHIALIRLTI